MATIDYSIVPTGSSIAVMTKWPELADGDVGVSFPFVAYADRSVQVVPSPSGGGFGGGAITIEGSHDGVNWATLTDLQGNALVMNNTRIEMVPELVQYIRPRVSSGTGVKLDVYLLTKSV
jgi:hypothetical protein